MHFPGSCQTGALGSHLAPSSATKSSFSNSLCPKSTTIYRLLTKSNKQINPGISDKCVPKGIHKDQDSHIFIHTSSAVFKFKKHVK